MRKLFIAAFMLTLLFLPACTQTDSKLATAVAQTQAVILIETLEPAAMDTPELTENSTPTPSPTFEPDPTFTVTPDLRVINTNPRLIILTQDEIAPIEEYGMYGSVPNYELYGNVINPYANLACILGSDEATEFLDKTGLVTGWTTQYILADMDRPMPANIEFNVLVFQTVDGPNLLFEEWGRSCEYHFYEFVEDIDIGEKATLCLNKHQEMVNDKPIDLYLYRLAIKYKNIYLGVQAQGVEESFDLEDLYKLIDLQMEKLAGLPLEEEVTLAQDFGIGVGCTVPPTSEVFKKGSDPGDDSEGIPSGLETIVKKTIPIPTPTYDPWGN